MKKISVSNILIWAAIALSGLWILILALGVFGAVDYSSAQLGNFNYIWAFAIVIIDLLLYIGFLFIQKIRNLIIPEWFIDVFFVGFFVFTNVYYFFGLYSTLAGLLIFDIYFAAVLNIVAVSLFYNTQKDNKNVVKTTDKFLLFSTFSYASLGILAYQLVVLAIKVMAGATGVFASIALVVSEVSLMLVVCFIFALIFGLSLKKSRKVINACLIKYNTPSDRKINK